MQGDGQVVYTGEDEMKKVMAKGRKWVRERLTKEGGVVDMLLLC